jgi:hypothetical protein
MAQRYCEVINLPPIVRFTASTQLGGSTTAFVSFAATKRAAPTVTLNSAANLGGTSGVLATTISGSGTTSSSFTVTPTVSGVALWNNAALVSVNDYSSIGSALCDADY